MVHQHLDGTISLTHGPQRLGHYSAKGIAIEATQTAAREKLWEINLKPDISFATKSGHFNLLPAYIPIRLDCSTPSKANR